MAHIRYRRYRRAQHRQASAGGDRDSRCPPRVSPAHGPPGTHARDPTPLADARNCRLREIRWKVKIAQQRVSRSAGDNDHRWPNVPAVARGGWRTAAALPLLSSLLSLLFSLSVSRPPPPPAPSPRTITGLILSITATGRGRLTQISGASAFGEARSPASALGWAPRFFSPATLNCALDSQPRAFPPPHRCRPDNDDDSVLRGKGDVCTLFLLSAWRLTCFVVRSSVRARMNNSQNYICVYIYIYIYIYVFYINFENVLETASACILNLTVESLSNKIATHDARSCSKQAASGAAREQGRDGG